MDSSEVDVCMYVCFFFPVWANKHDHRRQEHLVCGWRRLCVQTGTEGPLQA